ncbi:MAG: hypothetical protein M1821_002059 [Bathelium mastoideum]|nr:MAG: hypothetical protein M1821_002059 [Bathelium mastoideum]KAI9692567.1 MAG: hypothetical protein M1822_006798 [Bathelium mastoideum]
MAATNGSTNGTADGASSGPVPIWINGKEVTTSLTFPVNSPSTSQILHHSASASLTDALAAVDAAAAAFPAWSKTKPITRRNIFLRAADLLEQRLEEAAQVQVEETGIAKGVAMGFMVPTTVEGLRDTAGRIAGVMGAIPVAQAEGTSAVVWKESYGVNFGIAPWWVKIMPSSYFAEDDYGLTCIRNAPFILGVRACMYAIATGNTCVLKGSELSPKCYWIIGDIFHKAGLPAGVLNVIVHRPEDAAEITTSIINHKAIKKINFTGSTAIGRIISEQAGKALKPVLMELGGKASAVVLEDADIELAANECAGGAFMHAGQICMSTERILVHHSVLDAFTTALQSALAKFYPASGTAPTLVSPIGVKKNKALLDDAKSHGANFFYPSDTASHVDETSAYRLRPVIVSGVTQEMQLYHTESFGPSVSLFPIADAAEGIRIANDTQYGLSASVFSRDLARAFAVAREIDSGAVHINGMSVHDEPGLPHGGVKESGWGRFNGSWGLEEFVKLKTVTYKEGKV